MSVRTEIAFVDAIEGEMCRVLIGGESTPVELPRTCLPKKAQEGDWLRVMFEILPEMREQKRKKIKKMLEDMHNITDMSKSPL
jgi:hypothetical protein